MNEERFASRRLLLLLLLLFRLLLVLLRSGLSLTYVVSFASDTLFLVNFHLGFSSSSILRFHGGVFLRLPFLIFRRRVFYSRSNALGSRG